MVSDAVVDWAVILGAAFSAVTIIIVTANFALTHIKTPRSKIRLDQLSDDACVVDSGDDSNWLTLRWDFTAINDGKRDGNLTDPVFEDATFHAGGRSELVTPDDLGRGSTYNVSRKGGRESCQPVE
jgi:hypothetical protein